MTTTCISCSGLIGCRILADSHGRFVPERVLQEDSGTECASWSPVGPRQADVRTALYGIQGVNSLRVLHQLPAMVMDQLVEQESEDGMTEETPDFVGMIADGMSNVEREEQLRFETDADGNFIEDDGIRRPRPSHQLRKFACDPSGHVQLDHSVGMFWTTDKVINHIVAVEVEQGLITKAKRSKKDGATTKTAAKAAPKTETSAMAEGRRVMINRGGPKASKGADKGNGKVAKPPAKRAAKAAPKMSEPSEEASEAPAGFDFQDLVDDIKVVVGEQLADIAERLGALEKKMEEISSIEAVVDGKKVVKKVTIGHVLETLTILHDLACQTEGQFSYDDDQGEHQVLPEMFRNPDLLRGYITGAETPPDPEE